MELIESLGKIAKNISDVDNDQIQQVINEGKSKSSEWTTADSGVKGLYARLHRGEYGFLFRLLIILSLPFLVGLINKKLSTIYRTETEEEIIKRYLDTHEDED